MNLYKKLMCSGNDLGFQCITFSFSKVVPSAAGFSEWKNGPLLETKGQTLCRHHLEPAFPVAFFLFLYAMILSKVTTPYCVGNASFCLHFTILDHNFQSSIYGLHMEHSICVSVRGRCECVCEVRGSGVSRTSYLANQKWN